MLGSVTRLYGMSKLHIQPPAKDKKAKDDVWQHQCPIPQRSCAGLISVRHRRSWGEAQTHLAVLPFKPKYRLAHPENYLFSLSKKIYSGSKDSNNKLIDFEKGSTAI